MRQSHLKIFKLNEFLNGIAYLLGWVDYVCSLLTNSKASEYLHDFFGSTPKIMQVIPGYRSKIGYMRKVWYLKMPFCFWH